MISEHVVRERLQKRVREVPERVWQYLVRNRLVASVQDGEDDIDWLAERCRELIELGRPPELTADRPPEMLSRTDPPKPSDKRRGRRSTTDLRQQAIARLVAGHVDKDPEVAAFRAKFLGGRLLEPEVVEAWIKDKAAVDGEPTNWLNGVPLPAGHTLEWTGEGWIITPPLTVSRAPELDHRSVHYGVSDGEGVRAWMVTCGGVLDRLRVLSERLADWYGWQLAQATLFVLTGWAPRISIARAPLRPRRLSSLARLELTVDLTLTPREVADLYRRARGNALSRRHRALSERHIRLAAFAAETEGKPWAERMNAWNREHRGSDWEYSERRNFTRDCIQAQQRMLHLSLRDEPYGEWLDRARASERARPKS